MLFRNPLLATTTRALPTRIGVVGAGTIGPDIAFEVGHRAFASTACTAAARGGITASMEGRKPDFSTTP